MSASSDLQAAIIARLTTANVLPFPVVTDLTHTVPSGSVPLITRKTKVHGGRSQDPAEDLAAAIANHGLCLMVLPLLPQHCEPENPFIFFDQAEIRVRIIEQPALNSPPNQSKDGNGVPLDLYDVIDDVALALHNQILGDSPAQAQPLYLSEHPVDMEEGVIEGGRGMARIADVIFRVVYQLNPPS